MEALKKQRTSAKAAITRAQTFISCFAETASREAFETRLKLLDGAWADYKQTHDQLIQLAQDDEVEDLENDFEQVEVKYVDVDSRLHECINQKIIEATSLGQPTANSTTASVKLPRIDLPSFSGNFLEWTAFRDLFKSLVHDNKTIGASQKLHYLKTSVSHDAADLLHSIDITDANYSEAWSLLEERYQNERLLVQCHIKAIMDFPKLVEESSSGIRKLVDNTVKHLRALTAIGVEASKWDPIIVFTVTDKLDSETRRQWELASPGKTYPTFSDLKNYLDQRCRALDASGGKTAAKLTKSATDSVYRPKTRQMASSLHAASGEKSSVCVSCGGDHSIYKCNEFVKCTNNDRLATVRKNNLCFNCLRANHSAQQCKSESTCRTCGARHHTLLHHNRFTPRGDNVGNLVPTATVSTHFSGNVGIGQVLLSTAIINVSDCAGKLQQCRTILDSGSQASFVTKDCIQRLGLKRSRTTVSIIGIGQTGSGTAKGLVNLRVSSTVCGYSFDVCALVMSKLTGPSPDKFVDCGHWRHIGGLRLADPTFAKPGKIDIILGADVFGELLLEGRLVGAENVPSAYNTKLGWIISGKISPESPGRVLVNFASTDVQDQLKDFWELEEMLPKKHFTPEEQACETHFYKTHSRDADGRYQVRLPFKTDSASLGRSKDIANKRLYQVDKRLSKSEVLQTQYRDFLQQFLELDHMEHIPSSQQEELVGKTNYLPHHFVTKESTTTRLRVVFDASAKTSNGTSLNDKLLVGPKLQDDIWDIVLRFRLHKYVFTADIAMMYRQIKIHPEDADLQRILWKPSDDEPLQEFRLTTVAFGTASAPYLATKVLQQLAHDEVERFPLAHHVVLRDFYVDDLLSGANDITSGLDLQSQLIGMLKCGGFNLRKWSSNEPALLESLPEALRETEHPLEIGAGGAIKALGLHWHPGGDYLFFVVPAMGINKCTKRGILSDVASLYDPLGWLAPVIIVAKVFIQRLWSVGVSWDEQLSSQLEQEWLGFRGQLHHLQDCKIQRCVVGSNGIYCSLQLHGFSDASEMAYGAVVYLRSCNSDGNVVVRLLCAKTKVAPLKQVSIPRLELCGAVLLARLMVKVQSSIALNLNSVHAWTDSTVTLAWISGLPRDWKTFVANRVAEIQDLVPPSCWRHVATKDNPADVASRGLEPKALLTNQQWWNGPSWLADYEQWPTHCMDASNNGESLGERRAVKAFVVITAPKWELWVKISSLNKLIRVTAYCCRFVHNAKVSVQDRTGGVLKTGELLNALLVCIKAAQAEAFGDVISDLKTERVKGNHLRSLNPFVDEGGILRVGGRLRHAKCAYDQRFPMLLPKQHKLTELIVNNVHVSQLHAGHQATLAALHKRYWIVNGRSVVRHILHRCIKCFRDSAQTLQQKMADLPAKRVEPARPFLRCGVDYAGPLLIRTRKGRGGQTTKAYVALFVCFATKAIHLELVSDLSTGAFLSALKRFIARRGKCLEIHSDNGTNFVGADRELKVLLKQFAAEQHNTLVAEFLSVEGVSWQFIPAKAPHFGGLWEAGIKSTKTHLRRVVGNSSLTFEELYTVLTQIEACLNSRPLCPMSSDPNDLDVLTPGHFLIGEALTACPEPDLTHLRLNQLDRWQLVQRLTQHFWSRWQGEYLTHLQHRTKWTSGKSNLRRDDLVLVKEDNMPPLHWVRGRVLDVHPGKDNIVRVATVKTATGTFRRPIVKLCVLPL